MGNATTIPISFQNKNIKKNGKKIIISNNIL
jgi:hypothetical protein